MILIHSYLFLILYLTVTHKFLFILREGVLKYEPITYKYIEQNQEHIICYTSC